MSPISQPNTCRECGGLQWSGHDQEQCDRTKALWKVVTVGPISGSAGDFPTAPTEQFETSSPAWNDPLLNLCEGAPCPCGHEALDHNWYGCEECACRKSPIYALLSSGVVEVTPTQIVRGTDAESGETHE